MNGLKSADRSVKFLKKVRGYIVMNENEKLIDALKGMNSVDELLAFAKEKAMEMTEAEAKALFKQLKGGFGELEDDELCDVAGGLNARNLNTLLNAYGKSAKADNSHMVNNSLRG